MKSKMRFLLTIVAVFVAFPANALTWTTQEIRITSESDNLKLKYTAGRTDTFESFEDVILVDCYGREYSAYGRVFDLTFDADTGRITNPNDMGIRQFEVRLEEVRKTKGAITFSKLQAIVAETGADSMSFGVPNEENEILSEICARMYVGSDPAKKEWTKK